MSRIIASGASSQGFEADGSKGNAGEFLKTQGDGLPPVWGEVVSDRTLIATVDLAGASVAEFDGLFSTAYADFEFVLSNIQSTNTYASMLITYKKAGSWLNNNYGISSALDCGSTISTGNYPASAYGTASSSNITLLPGINQYLPSSNSLASVNGVIKISSPNTSLAHVSVFDGFFNSNGDGGTGLSSTSRYVRVVGSNLTGGLLEGVRITTSNVISSGKIHLYGIRPL